MFKNSSFLFLWGGQALSNIGDRLYILALITYIYKTTNSALLASYVPLVRLVTQLLSSLLTPVVTYRLEIRKVLAASQLIQSILIVILLFFLLDTGRNLLFMSSVVILLSFLHSWINPLKNAILPEVVSGDELVKANNVLSITDQCVLFLGWMGGGVLISRLGSISVLWITLVLFLASTVAFLLIRLGSSATIITGKRVSWSVITEGWVYITHDPLYRRLFVMGSIQSIAGSVWTGAIILAFVKDVLHENESWWGFLNGAWLLGAILTGFFFSKWIRTWLASALMYGLFLNAIMVAIFASCWNPLFVLGVSFLMGIPYQIHDVAKKTLLQLNAKKEKLPQIFAAYQAVGSVFFGLGIFIMGFLVDFGGVQMAYYLSSFFLVLSAWLAKGVLRLAQ